MHCLIETKQNGSTDWQQSKTLQPSMSDAIHAIGKIGITIRSRKQSGLFEARVIPVEDKNWKRQGSEPQVLHKISF